MSTITVPDVTTLPITLAGYCIVIDDVALELTFDPADGTYGIKYAWTDDEDFADGFAPENIGPAIVEWVEWAERDHPGHPKPHASCYGCQGTGTIRWAGMRLGVACSCVNGQEG